MSVAVVVLAAGGSSRMGRPKQLLPWHGRTLLRHAVEVACGSTHGPVVVVLGHGAAELAPEMDGLRVHVVENANWERGPGTSVRAGAILVESLSEVEAAVFLLCDQPLVDEAHVGRLIAAWRESGRSMAASGYAGTAGVPALFDRGCFPALRGLEPTAGARQLLACRPYAVAVVPFPAGAIDLDTPEDYERLQRDSPGPTEVPHAPGI